LLYSSFVGFLLSKRQTCPFVPSSERKPRADLLLLLLLLLDNRRDRLAA